AVGLGAGDGADVEEQGPGRVLRRGRVVGDRGRSRRLERGERRSARCADADDYVVALVQVADAAADRPAVGVDQDLGRRADGEALVLALADESLQRVVVAALDLQLHGRRARREQLAAEFVRPPSVGSAGGGGDGRDGDRGECRQDERETVLHGWASWGASMRTDRGFPPSASGRFWRRKAYAKSLRRARTGRSSGRSGC